MGADAPLPPLATARGYGHRDGSRRIGGTVYLLDLRAARARPYRPEEE